MKKIVFLLITLVGTFAQGAWAWSGRGTADNPYILTSIADWETFSNNISNGIYADKNFKLADNWNNSEEPVTVAWGTEEHPFTGTFDGNGKMLYVNISDTETQGTAPFRNVKGASLGKLTVVGEVTGTSHAAGLVGFVRAGGTTTISDCIVRTTVNNSSGSCKEYIGGLVGHATTATLVIQNSVFSGNLNSTSDYAGGLQGWSDGNTLTIIKGFFTGTHSGDALFHPIALHYYDKTTQFTDRGAFYLNTVPSTVTDQQYIAATGKPIYSEYPVYVHNFGEVISPDGEKYYTESVSYNVRSWDEENKKVVTTYTSCPAYFELTGSHEDDWIGLDDGYYVVSGYVTYKVLNIVGTDVHLILKTYSTLSCAHIKLEEGHSLSIYSQSDHSMQGKLNVKNYKTSSWNTVYSEAAAIGSGGDGVKSGNLYVHGGIITADNYAYNIHAAGIGGGHDCALGGDLVFYGGIVNAISYNGDGIGCGDRGKDSAGSITIYGGNITACSDTNAGIGSNAETGHDLTIWGGTVHATSTTGAGIGGGFDDDGGKVHIHGGTVTAISEKGAGIGGGIIGEGGDVHIHGGIIYAKGGWNAAGIGGASGEDDLYEESGGTLEVTGGFVYATSIKNPNRSYTAPAIGSGTLGKGANVSITGGTVIAAITKMDDYKCAPIGGRFKSKDFHLNNEDGLLVVGDGMMVSYSNEYFALTKDDEPEYQAAPTGELTVANATERVSNAQLHGNSYVKIEPCPHEGTFTYTLLDNSYHNKKCDVCGVDITESHIDENCELCGLGQTSKKISFYVPNTEADGGYQLLKEYEVAVNKEFLLPECTTVPEGYVFEGREMNPETVGNYMAVLGNDIQEPGTEHTLSGYSDDATFYARYLYDFIESWAWNEDGSSFLVNLWHPQTNITIGVPYDASTPEKTRISSEEETDDKGNVYGTLYTAHVCWTDRNTGYEYRFSSLLHVFNLLTITDNADNATAISQAAGKTMERVTLSGRTLYRDGSWNTLCLPFDIPRGYDLSLLYDASAVKILESSEFDTSTGTLTLNFADRDEIPAGTPFILKWNNELDNNGEPVLSYINEPYFKYVTIPEGITAGSTSTDYVDFVGTFSPVSLTANDRKVLYLGADDMLYYPSADVPIGSCRAYFQLHNGITAGNLNGDGAKAFVLNFGDEETGIREISTPSNASNPSNACFTLDGLHLKEMPTTRGIYIIGDKKVIIK